MANHRVSVRAFDAMSSRIAQFTVDVSTDSGATWQHQPLVDGKSVFAVSEGLPFRIRVLRDGLWPVTQEFIARGAPNFELAAVGNMDPAIAHDASVCSIEADHLHLVDVYLTLFRDASEDLMDWERKNRPPNLQRLPVPDFTHGIMDFAGLPVTSTNGPSVIEMAGTERQFHSYGPGTGELFLLHAPVGVRGPRLVAAYVPNCVDVSEPLPFVTYFMPESRFPGMPYPYFDHIETLSTYLVGGNRRNLSQVNCSRKRVVFFFPLLPARTDHIPHVGNGTGLRAWLHEVTYWIRRQKARNPRVSVSVGRCALTSFSAGATGLLDVVESGGFQELRELFLLDPSDHNNSSDTSRARLVSSWSGNGRMWRVYTQYGSWLAALQHRFSTAPITGPAGSTEWHTPETSLAFLPQTYWMAATSHHGNLAQRAFEGSAINPTSVHQRIPQFFLQHALKNSGFASA